MYAIRSQPNESKNNNNNNIKTLKKILQHIATLFIHASPPRARARRSRTGEGRYRDFLEWKEEGDGSSERNTNGKEQGFGESSVMLRQTLHGGGAEAAFGTEGDGGEEGRMVNLGYYVNEVSQSRPNCWLSYCLHCISACWPSACSTHTTLLCVCSAL